MYCNRMNIYMQVMSKLGNGEVGMMTKQRDVHTHRLDAEPWSM